jgi:RNA polymerase sigma factor (sigma-70 family)
MAKFTPTGWKMSEDGKRRFESMYQACLEIVRSRARKYNLPSNSADDIVQEGMLAAAYAVDTYKPERGKLEGYISRVVFNALAMVATEVLALSRQPHKHVQDPDGTWRRVPMGFVELDGDQGSLPIPDESIDPHIARRESSTELSMMSKTFDERLASLNLSDDARCLLAVRLKTPPELWIMSRNLSRGRMNKLDAQAICLYLSWALPGNMPDRPRFNRAAHELRIQFRVVLGVDDITFEPLETRLSVNDRHQLMVGAKRRELKEACRCS